MSKFGQNSGPFFININYDQCAHPLGFWPLDRLLSLNFVLKFIKVYPNPDKEHQMPVTPNSSSSHYTHCLCYVLTRRYNYNLFENANYIRKYMVTFDSDKYILTVP